MCGDNGEIEHPDTWKQVTGLVGGPKKDSMRLREDTGEYAHDACVAKVQAGQAVNQPSMFDLAPEEEDTSDERESNLSIEPLPDLLRGE